MQNLLNLGIFLISILSVLKYSWPYTPVTLFILKMCSFISYWVTRLILIEPCKKRNSNWGLSDLLIRACQYCIIYLCMLHIFESSKCELHEFMHRRYILLTNIHLFVLVITVLTWLTIKIQHFFGSFGDIFWNTIRFYCSFSVFNAGIND
jgi:hypothetical protein